MNKEDALKAIEMYKKSVATKPWLWYADPYDQEASQEEVDEAIASIAETARKRNREP